MLKNAKLSGRERPSRYVGLPPDMKPRQRGMTNVQRRETESSSIALPRLKITNDPRLYHIITAFRRVAIIRHNQPGELASGHTQRTFTGLPPCPSAFSVCSCSKSFIGPIQICVNPRDLRSTESPFTLHPLSASIHPPNAIRHPLSVTAWIGFISSAARPPSLHPRLP